MAAVSTVAITAGRAKHAEACHEERSLSPDGAGYALILPLSGRARGAPQRCRRPTFRPALLGVGLSLVRQYEDIMMSGESDETKKAEEQPNMSLAATSAVCCGALFGAMVSGVEKLVELEWYSDPFWFLSYALAVETGLFGVACLVFAISLMLKRRKKNVTVNDATSVNDAVKLNSDFDTEQQDRLEQLKKDRLRSEIQRNKAVTRCAKEARQLILAVAFLLFISAMNRSDH